ncbi:hypothetical protein LCGC14_1200690 [marine sediment metagenome]|uniref:Uncharacterized protein n=1 Tax=marine sediment metagenome TaxID=412755 RepID=A0A0F9NZD0_9ZZZZ
MENVKQLIVKEVEKIKVSLTAYRASHTLLEEELSKNEKYIDELVDALAEYKVVWDIIEKEENDIDINDIYEGKTND